MGAAVLALVPPLALDRSEGAANDAEGALSSPELKPSLEFRTIYQTWFNEVGRWVVAMGGRSADRDDLVQDVFLVVHRRLPDFDGQNLGGWLYQITRRRVRDFRRSMWLRRLLFGVTNGAETAAPRNSSPGTALETKEKREMLELLLAKLQEPERVALVLFEVDGCSGEQIAEIQGVPANTIWARIRRARIKLRAGLLELEAC